MVTGQSGQAKAEIKQAENPSVHGLAWESLDLGPRREREAGKIPVWWGWCCALQRTWGSGQVP